MTDLTNDPGIPFSYPTPARDGKTDGMIYVGNYPMRDEDYKALVEHTGNDGVKVDPRSVVGLYHYDWSTYRNEVDDVAKQGGVGSKAYETQLWGGEGVEFTQDAIWHYNANNEYVKEVPGTVGEHYFCATRMANVVGERSGSAAADFIAGHKWVWDENRELWDREL